MRSLVLVADDNDGVRNLVGTVVKRLNLTPLSVADGAEAVRVALQHREKLCGIILDVVMPELDGIEAARAIRQIDNDLPIILMSAAFPSDYQQKITSLRITHLLHKPFALAELTQALRPFYQTDL